MGRLDDRRSDPGRNFLTGQLRTNLAVSTRPLTAEIRVRAWVSQCWFCVGQCGTGTGFYPSSLVFPCQYYSIVAVQTHVTSGGWTQGPLVAAVQRHDQQQQQQSINFQV
jgi:hypothetical protein